MNLYLVTCSEGLTGNYHSGGAMLVYASSEEDALAVFHEERYRGGRYTSEVKDAKPDVKLIMPSVRGCLAILPDAGCC